MRIDKALNLVVQVENEDGQLIHVHSMALLRETFERYFLVISKTFAAIHSEGLGAISGPRIAALMLKRIALDMGEWEGVDGIENGLVSEIRRLSNVIMPTDTGWQSVPFQDAITHQYLSAEDIEEVEGIIVFFILNSAMHRQVRKQTFIDAGAQLWGALTTSLSVTEYRNSLPTSSDTAITGQPVSEPEVINAPPLKPSLVAY